MPVSKKGRQLAKRLSKVTDRECVCECVASETEEYELGDLRQRFKLDLTGLILHYLSLFGASLSNTFT